MRAFNMFLTTFAKCAEVVIQFILVINILFWIGEYDTLKTEYALKKDSICYFDEEQNDYVNTDNAELKDKLRSSCNQNTDWYFSAAILLMCYFHVMHINVLTNIRLKLVKTAPSCCICFWYPVNWLICKFDRFENGCRKICNDQCFKIHTIAKWIPYYIVFIIFNLRLQDYFDIIDTYDTELNW